jgi:hypothetical protein
VAEDRLEEPVLLGLPVLLAGPERLRLRARWRLEKLRQEVQLRLAEELLLLVQPLAPEPVQ